MKSTFVLFTVFFFVLTFGTYSTCETEIQINGEIAVISSRDSKNEVYPVNENGSNLTKLANNDNYNSLPSRKPSSIESDFLPIQWTRIADLPGDQHAATAEMIEGYVYMIGGQNAGPPPNYNKMRIYDPHTDSWSNGPSMTARRYLPGSGVIEYQGQKELYVVGGYSGYAGLSVVERYVDDNWTTPGDGHWESAASIAGPRGHGIMCSVVNNNLYAIGGFYNNTSYYSTNQMYDRENNTWITKTSLPYAMQAGQPAVWGGKIYIFGGSGSGVTYDSTFIYDPEENAWSYGTAVPHRRIFGRAVCIGDNIYLIANTGQETNHNIIDIYNPATDTWLSTDDYQGGNWSTPTITQDTNTIYVLGATYTSPSKLECWVGSTEEIPVEFPDISTGAIVYYRNSDIYISDIEGNVEKNLTNSSENESVSSISPDLTKITFERDENLWLMDIDGSNQEKLVDKSQIGNNHVQWSDWTLDSEWIYFNAVSGCCSGGIWKVRCNDPALMLKSGLDLEKWNELTPIRSGYITELQVRKNYGDRLIFNQRRNSLSYSENVRITDMNGNNEEIVTGGGPSESSATFGTCWSPDGTKFAYNYGHQHIFVASYPAPYNPVEIKTFSIRMGHQLTWLDNNTLIYTDDTDNQMVKIDVNTLEESYLGINGFRPYVRRSSSTATIVVDAPESALPGDSFWVDIKAQDVQNLFGVSFVLNYTQGTYVDVVTTEAGDFLGNDIVFYPEVNEEAGTVSVGMSRKAGQGEVEGSGVLTRIQFTSSLETPLGTVTEFSLSEITANNEDGNPLVLTAVGDITTITKTVTVWPGDTNNDGTVDQADVLPLGLYWASTGPAREGGSYQWIAQLCQTWSPEAATYADATGDGKVNQEDVLPIGLNWDKTQVIPKITVYNTGNTANKTVAAAAVTKPVPFIELPVKTGDEFWVEIQVSDVSSLFGMSFVLTYDNKDAIEPLTCEQGTFMGDDVIIFSQVDNNADEVAVGISRKSGQGGVNGTGTVVRIKFGMSQDLDVNSGINLCICDVVANDPSGENINLTIEDGQIGTIVKSDELSRLPRKFSLSQNSPNPFNPSTTIQYSIPEGKSVKVRLNVYDLRGALVRTLVNQVINSGIHSVVWDGIDTTGNRVSSGVYIYRIQAGRFSKTNKMLLIR